MAITVDSILKLPGSKKLLILIGVLSLITGLYLYLFYLPMQDQKKVLRAELDKLMKELNEGKMVTRDLEKFRSQVETLNAELASALTQLPNEKEIPEILRNISRLGKESSLEFTLFKPKPETLQQFYATVPIDLVMLGSYHNIAAFFDQIGKLPRIINVVDFHMTRPKEAKGKETAGGLIRVSSLIATYRFIEKKSEEKKSDGKTVPKGKK